MNQLEIFCVTNKQVPQLEKTKYKLAAVGMNKFSDIYLTCDTGDNIFDKEKIPFSIFILPTYKRRGLSSKGLFIFCNHLALNSDGKTKSYLFFPANLF